jgi:hypothetical protein
MEIIFHYFKLGKCVWSVLTLSSWNVSCRIKGGTLEKMNLNVYIDEVLNQDEEAKEWILNLFQLMNK